jgi:hypothetical protein
VTVLNVGIVVYWVGAGVWVLGIVWNVRANRQLMATRKRYEDRLAVVKEFEPIALYKVERP